MGIERKKSDLVYPDGETSMLKPPSAEYKLSTLRSMRVRLLKETLADKGVFFNPNDVVEKEDIIQLFVHSGRLTVLPEDGEDKGERRHDDDDDDDDDAKIPATATTQVNSHNDNDSDSYYDQGRSNYNAMVVETVDSDQEREDGIEVTVGNIDAEMEILPPTGEWSSDSVMMENLEQEEGTNHSQSISSSSPQSPPTSAAA